MEGLWLFGSDLFGGSAAQPTTDEVTPQDRHGATLRGFVRPFGAQRQAKGVGDRGCRERRPDLSAVARRSSDVRALRPSLPRLASNTVGGMGVRQNQPV